MAIAPLLDTESADWSENPYGASWPRTALQLVPDPDETDADVTTVVVACDVALPAASVHVLPRAAVLPMVRTGVDVVRRRARRAAVRRRRRAVVLATVAAGLTCGLALPLASVGGSPVAAHPQARASVAGETVYVVRPGDTLWSIAARFERGGNPRPMAEALAREIGSAVVVPGERIRIP